MASPAAWQREGWKKTDFSRTRVDFKEIISGGPPKDGIPSIDKPRFVPVAKEAALSGRDPVLSLTIGKQTRAYPLRVLIWHEIVNDVVGGVPVAVTYCPLCNSGVIFDRRLNGRVLEFGTTGKLRNSDLVMYDRQSESWWQQFTGEAIVGELTGETLKKLPARLESFADFKARAGAGAEVLQPPAATGRSYGRNPYTGYDSASKPFLYSGSMPDGIEPLARVVAVQREGKPPLLVTLEHVRKKTPVTFGDVRLQWKPGQASALDTASISKGRDVGSVIAQVRTGPGGWKDAVYDITFAFVVHAFHKDVPIRGKQTGKQTGK